MDLRDATDQEIQDEWLRRRHCIDEDPTWGGAMDAGEGLNRLGKQGRGYEELALLRAENERLRKIIEPMDVVIDGVRGDLIGENLRLVAARDELLNALETIRDEGGARMAVVVALLRKHGRTP